MNNDDFNKVLFGDCKNQQFNNLESSTNENLKFLQTLIETIPSAIFYKDINFVYRLCNNKFLEILGLNREDIIGHTAYDISPRELADIYNNADKNMINSNSIQTYESKIIYADGSPHDVMFSKAIVFNSKGNITGIVGVINDITERKRNEKKIKKLLKIKEAMLELNNLIMEIHDTNRLLELILGKVINALDATYNGNILVFDKNSNLIEIARNVAKNEQRTKGAIHIQDPLLLKNLHKRITKSIIINDIHEFIDKDIINIISNFIKYKFQSAIMSPIILENKLLGIINIFSENSNAFDKVDLDIMEYVRNQVQIYITNHTMYEKIIYLSRHDKLTELYNRSYFEDLFEKCLKEYTKNNRVFFLVLIDLNGLKLVNDTYGHLAGDKYISIFADKLKKIMNPLDILSRLGGDEFSIISFEKNLDQLINKLKDLLNYFTDDGIIHKKNKIVCSFSYGIAAFPKEGNNYTTLMKLADKRMYKYKQNYKNASH